MKGKKNEREIYQSNTHKKVLERMQLISMVPLDVNPKDASHPPKSALEQTFEFKDRSMSKFAKMLNYNIKGDISRMLDPNSEPPKYQHSITSYKPAFEVPESSAPEPASYHPLFDSIKPSTIVPNIGIIPPAKVKKDVTTAALLENFSKGLRDFDPDKIERAQDKIEPEKTEEKEELPLPKTLETFDKQMKRDNEMLKTSLVTNIDYYTPPSPKVKVTDFKRQSTRTEIFPTDSGRDYSDKALMQMDKLKSKPSNSVSMKRQLSRDYVPPKNERVAFLDSIAQQQRALLEKIKPKRAQSRQQPPKKETFAMQAPRGDILDLKPQPDSKFPLNPLKSLKYVYPKVPAIKISESKREPKDFWKA